ncbi:hypothetical protein MBLNU457_4127t3 [Dothideomycetes sp. NU457]
MISRKRQSALHELAKDQDLSASRSSMHSQASRTDQSTSTTPPQKKARTIAYSDPAFSDLTLKFDGQARKVQKAILCNKSGWFSTALTSSFMEAQSDTIELFDDDANVLNAMLDFCYEGELYNICGKYGPEDSPATFLVQLYEIADKYLVAPLLEDIEIWFGEHFRRSCTNKEQEDALELMYSIPDVYMAGLKTRVLLDLRNDLGKMVTRDTFQELFTRQPLLAVDILKMRGKYTVGSLVEKRHCPECRHRFRIVKDLDSSAAPLFCVYCAQDSIGRGRAEKVYRLL